MTFEVDFRRKTRKTCVSPERFLRPANAKGAEGHRYECRKTPKMREKRPRGPKNAMAGVENKWAKSGHLRNRSIPSGEAFKTPEKTCQSASKRTDFRPCSPVPHPPQRKALACASRALGPCARGSALGRATYLKASNLAKGRPRTAKFKNQKPRLQKNANPPNRKRFP